MHPIDTLMESAMENIKGMVDVNTIVGDPVETPDGTVIIPISRVSFGFAAGGTDFVVNEKEKGEGPNPFGGGSGAGVMLHPMAFLVVNERQVRLLPVNNGAFMDRLLNMAPDLMEQIKEALGNKNGGMPSRK